MVNIAPDISNYEKPTDEEVAMVMDYWNQVRRVVNTGVISDPLVKVDHELLIRVGVHQAWQSAMICTHREITLDMDGIRCGECGRPCTYLSDVQIAEMKK